MIYAFDYNAPPDLDRFVRLESTDVWGEQPITEALQEAIENNDNDSPEAELALRLLNENVPAFYASDEDGLYLAVAWYAELENNTDYPGGVRFYTVPEIREFIVSYYSGEPGDQYRESWRVVGDEPDDIYDVLKPVDGYDLQVTWFPRHEIEEEI